MIFEIKFTPEAVETYNAVISQLSERWGNRYVDKFETKIYKTLDAISIAPYSYPNDINNFELRKCILHKNCFMFTRLMETVF